VLRIEHLWHTYADGTRALCDVSLDVPTGLFGLLGPNGAGKSTLMRVLATVQRPSGGGRVMLDALDVLAHPAALRRTLGYLPQDFGVYPRITATALLDHLAVLKGIAGRGERRALVEQLLAQVGLWEARGKPLTAMSGGMRQRFGIAQALIGRPRLLIVDEPTAGLDPGERFRCLDLIAGLGDEAVVILSTHIVADAAALCDRVAVLAGGRVLTAGTPADLVAALAGRVWRGEVGRDAVPRLRETGALLWAQLVGGRTVAHVRAERASLGFTAVGPSLEDAYFAALLDG
jgi:ABC-2 type transport system ATP-binding protein